jgi:hypothetical protein
VYFQLQRNVCVRSALELDRALNDAALALAQIADIYYENHAGQILRIPDEDLRSGLFGDGATTFKSSAGHEFNALSMLRIDVMHCMEVLAKPDEVFAIARRQHGNHDAVAQDASASPRGVAGNIDSSGAGFRSDENY